VEAKRNSEPAKQARSIKPGASAPGIKVFSNLEPAQVGERCFGFYGCRPFHGLSDNEDAPSWG